jgi:uncharacterized protein YggT (Ycf19 family)
MIRNLLNFYIFALILDTILSYFPDLKKHKWRRLLKKICDLTCDPIRKQLPPHLPFDFSPLLVIMIINIVIFLW